MTSSGSPGLNVGDWTFGRQELDAQVAVLNTDFAGTGLQWRLASATWHENQTWAGDCMGNAGVIMASVVREPEAAANVVLCNPGALGAIIGPPSIGKCWTSGCVAG